MADARHEILDWVEQGRIAPQNLRAALEAAGALPSADEWRGFLERLLLWLGTVFLVAAGIFFIAYNWAGMGRYAKFALAEIPIVLALGLLWGLGLERAAGRAALLAAALLTGALLALIGQIYQTGADTFELFAAWAVAILPWVLVGRFAALWIVWIAIVNLALVLYFQTFGGIFGILFGPERQLWLLFALNTAALTVWEGCALAGVEWLRKRWAVRVLATASGGLATTLALFDILDWRSASGLGVPAWLAWLGCAYLVYRRRIQDIFVLAGGALSLIVVVATFLGERLLDHGEGMAFLLIGLIVIGLSAAAGWWLRSIAREERA
jgi:uncharacterized membrane protein